MISHFNQKRIEFAREYLHKHGTGALATREVVDELCDETTKLWIENQLLRGELFDIEQEQDPDKRWENILAAKLDRAIAENRHKDYFEITSSTNNGIYIITIQRKFGQTPDQLRRSSDIRRLKAAKKIVHLLADNKQMQKKLVDQGNEIRLLKMIRKGEWDEIKTRQDIELAINMVNGLIRQFNQEFYKKELGKLSNSMREAYHESWTRVAEIQWKNTELQKTIQTLKVELNRKNVEKLKFAKYRKRG